MRQWIAFSILFPVVMVLFILSIVGLVIGALGRRLYLWAAGGQEAIAKYTGPCG